MLKHLFTLFLISLPFSSATYANSEAIDINEVESIEELLIRTGNGVGNGGDSKVIEFQNQARSLASKLVRLNNVCQSKIRFTLSSYLNAIVQTKVHSTDKILKLDGQRVEAINFPNAKLIIFNREDWEKNTEKWQFVLHEYMGIMRIEDSLYERSQAVIDLVNDPSCFENRSINLWKKAKTKNGIAYFMFDSFLLIKRYNLKTQRELSDIKLKDIPNDFAVDNNFIYVLYDNRISRIKLNGLKEKEIFKSEESFSEVETAGKYLTLTTDRKKWGEKNFYLITKDTGIISDSHRLHTAISGISYNRGNKTIYGITTSNSPSDINAYTLENGKVIRSWEPPYHGAYHIGSQTYVFPNGKFVTDTSGTVYTAKDLRYRASFARVYEDIAFYKRHPILLDDGKLYIYSKDFLQLGTVTPDISPNQIFVWGRTVFAFSMQSRERLFVEPIDINSFFKKVNLCLVDPSEVDFKNAQVVKDKNDVIYFLSHENECIFRWSPELQDFLPSLSTSSENVQQIAYSEVNNKLYLSYESGSINQIDLSEVQPIEKGFVNLAGTVLGLQTAGKFIFATDPSGAWSSHYVFNPTGELVTSSDWRHGSQHLTWDPVNRRMFYFTQHSPRDMEWGEIDITGKIIQVRETPSHSSEGLIPPIRISPNGSLAVLGSGRIYNTHLLTHIDDLGQSVTEAVWVNNKLYTVRTDNGFVHLHGWTDYFQCDVHKVFSGDFIGLVETNGQGIVIIQNNEKLEFHFFDQNVQPLAGFF